MLPLVGDIVMSFVDEPPVLAVEPMLCTEALSASVAVSREVERLVSVTVAEVIVSLVLGRDCAVFGAGDRCHPRASLL